MRERILGAVVGFAVLAGMPVWAQMHKVGPPPQQVVRAVGVYEWTGDMAKPNASRLIPITLFINGQFQDAGVYLARPVPLALATGNVYELRVAGLGRGLLDLEYARHVQDANNDFEDSWYGYGKFRMPAPPRPVTAKRLPPARTSGIVSTVADSDRPTLVRRGGSENGSGNSSGSGSGSGSGSASTQTTASSGSTPTSDPDRPVLHRPSDDSAGSSGTDGGYGGSDPSSDPDRPILQKPANESAGSGAPAASQSTTAAGAGTNGSQSGTADVSSGATAASSGGSAPGDDPDRPTLKRRSPEEAKQAREEASVQGTGVDLALNNDPSRPRLHFGVPAGEGASGPARLVGLPVDLHQIVAVSDAVDREPHNFARNWTDAEERAAILTKMQALARAQLAAYGAPPGAAASKTKTAAQRTRKKVVAAPPPVALMDEVLRGYTLSYGGDATYVYMAHTAGTGSALRYVTVVAQTDEMGQFKPVIQSVTDAAHLDRTAQMKFVDVVDADATNRASLLFELKSQSMRQFALYRVMAGQAQQIFVSGTTE